MLSNKERNDILSNDPIRLWKAYWIPIIVITAIVFILLFTLYFSGVFELITNPNSQIIITYLYFFFGAILTVLINFVSSLIWEGWKKGIKREEENVRLKNLKSIANTDLLSSALSNLDRYNGIYCKAYMIDVKLTKSNYSSLLKCSVTYHYIKNIKNTELRFRFIRITNEDEADTADLDRDYHIENEYYYRSDERTFDKGLITNKDYKITKLLINDIRQQFKVSESGNIIDYSCVLDISKINTEISLSFSVEYLVEMDSFTFFIFDFPTNGVECNFDYSTVADKIDLYSYNFINSEKGLSKMHDREELKHSYKDSKCWALPKSNFLFIWYKK